MATGGLLPHPVRLRIVLSFLGARELTTGQLAAELPEVSKGVACTVISAFLPVPAC